MVDVLDLNTINIDCIICWAHAYLILHIFDFYFMKMIFQKITSRGAEVDVENLFCACYFSYVTPFHPHDISVRCIFPFISQVGKLRYRLDRWLKPLALADAALQSSDRAWFCGTSKLVLSAASQPLSVLQPQRHAPAFISSCLE